MKRKARDSGLEAADAYAIRRAAREVGIQITIATSLLVVAVLAMAFALVFERISPGRLFASDLSNEATVRFGGLDIIIAGLLIGALAIVVAGVFSVFATRRAVRPLGEALRLQRAFVADASHELRTPLAVLDARLQLLQRGLAPDDTAAPIVSELRHDTKTLIDIVNELLTSAEIGGRSASRPVEVNRVVQLAINSMAVLAANKNVTIKYADTAPLSTMITATSLHRCLVALLDNALDFAPQNSTVTVSLTARKQMMRLSVRDEGPGIRGIEPDRIFDRFARSDPSAGGVVRSGFGIGLSLVRDTVEKVGGRASVFSTSGAGTEIELIVPIAH